MYDVIGDVHGCFEELIELVEKLGYKKDIFDTYVHPQGRKLVFVGDIADKGPLNVETIDFLYRHVKKGRAEAIQGNHCNKLHRALKGNPITIRHGLQITLDQLRESKTEEQLSEYQEFFEALPYHLPLDDGKLLICHAAPPSDDCGRKQNIATCLYGVVTGKRLASGYPERLNWVPAYNRDATEDTPFVVFGHVTHEEVYLTDYACCVDTGCFMGNRLSALRWPEREVVDVESRQGSVEGKYLVKPEHMKESRYVSPEPIRDMSIDYLMERFKNNEEDFLYLIDIDEDLKTRETEDGLVIANASKGLFEPEYEHQFFAKGIVFERDPYRLVSLPLIKMHNHGCREFSDEISERYQDDAKVVFVEKMDGTMIQAFNRDHELILTTRSVIEGAEDGIEEGDFDYLGEARKLAEDINLTHMIKDHETFIMEFIHPENRIVTNYGEEKKLTLLSVFDRDEMRYLTSGEVKEIEGKWGIPAADVFFETDNLEDGVARIHEELGPQDNIPEGAVVCFEKDGRVVHRVKVKTMEYLRLHRLKFQCTYSSVVEMIWNKPELQNWERFQNHLKKNDLTDEEILEFYQDHFGKFMDYLSDVKERRYYILNKAHFYKRMGDIRLIKFQSAEFYKFIALAIKKNHPEILPQVMNYWRNFKERDKGEVWDTDALPLLDLMWNNPPCNNFKAIVTRYRDSQ